MNGSSAFLPTSSPGPRVPFATRYKSSQLISNSSLVLVRPADICLYIDSQIRENAQRDRPYRPSPGKRFPLQTSICCAADQGLIETIIKHGYNPIIDDIAAEMGRKKEIDTPADGDCVYHVRPGCPQLTQQEGPFSAEHHDDQIAVQARIESGVLLDNPLQLRERAVACLLQSPKLCTAIDSNVDFITRGRPSLRKKWEDSAFFKKDRTGFHQLCADHHRTGNAPNAFLHQLNRTAPC